MKSVLLLPFYDSHIKVLAPIAERLKSDENLEPLVLYLDGIHSSALLESLKKHKIPFVRESLPVSSFHTKDIDNAALVEPFRHPFRNLRALINAKKQVKLLFDRLNPSLVVTMTEAYFAERFILEEAKRRHIPSICLFSVVPDKKITPIQNKSRLGKLFNIKMLSAAGISLLLSPVKRILVASGLPINDTPVGFRADRILVWNEDHRDILTEKGANLESISIVGSPLYDLIFKKQFTRFGESREQIFKKLGIPLQDSIIMFVSQPLAKHGICSAAEQRRLTELVVETCAGSPGSHLVIKLHPRETADEYSYITGGQFRGKCRVVADKDIDLHSLIDASRVVLNQNSTVGIDAVLCDKDIITLNLIKLASVDYAEFGASLKVTPEADLGEALRRVLHDESLQRELKEKRREYIRLCFPYFDGKATDRVVDLIHRMLSQKNN
ncbi:MAG: hypothetical protein PHR56_07570 [Dehalococcoidales bacterium]|nr:hypothetical protein [Dehalococcoidales bacterium]